MKEERYKKALHTLNAEADIEGSCIVSRDGMLIYSDMRDVHAEVFAAMLATLLSSAEVATDEIKAGVPDAVVVEGKNKKIIVMGAGAHALLACITSADVDEVREALQKAASAIDTIASEKK